MLKAIINILLWDRNEDRFAMTRPRRGETDRDYAKRLRKMHFKFLDE
jgi:hypothetical protein